MKTKLKRPTLLAAAHGSAFTLVETCVVLAIIGLLALMLWAVHHKETVEMPEAYAAWVKQTGNEKHLTYEEWRSLMRANEKQNDTTIIFVPH